MHDVIVPAPALKRFCGDILTRGGLSPEHALCVANVLVWADLRGVDSHGIFRIPQYLRLLKTGDMNGRPDIRTTSETPAALVIDADQAAGPVAMTAAMNAATRKAREAGVGTVFVRRMTHAATLGYYALGAAREGMASISFVASGPLMAYHGAAGSAVSTSPICMAAPNGKDEPIMVDMGAGVISNGRLLQAKRLGQQLDPGQVLDKAGKPTTDPAAAHALLPMAGPKGSGLALLIEMIASLITSTPILAEAIEGTDLGKRHRQNGVVVAIDIARFCDVTEFNVQVKRLVTAIKGLAPTSDAGVLLPGERGSRVSARRLREGIPVAKALVAELEKCAAELSVPMFTPLA